MKKRLSLLLVIVIVALTLCACGGVKGIYTPAAGKTASELSSIRFDGKNAVFTLSGEPIQSRAIRWNSITRCLESKCPVRYNSVRRAIRFIWTALNS